MRSRDPHTAVEDAILAGQTIVGFLGQRTFAEYASDRMLASAVERQFEILGEALSRAMRADVAITQRVPEAQGVISFRNILAHGYDVIEDEIVYDIAVRKLPTLLDTLLESKGISDSK
ncbi:MAG: HepT-like ribonuclease domain-containing protein [Coriobacteriia bacterium]